MSEGGREEGGERGCMSEGGEDMGVRERGCVFEGGERAGVVYPRGRGREHLCQTGFI